MTPDEQFLTGQYLPGGQLPASRDSGPDGDGQPSAEDLFGPGRTASPAEVRDELRRQMGHDAGPVPRHPEHPGIHELAEDLGLA